MAPSVKICGLTRPRDVEAAILYGADYLGFIVEAPSKRRLTLDQAAKISEPAKHILPRVAVTVNADNELIANIISEMQPDYIQFHGDETPARLSHIKAATDVKIIKAVAISSATDLWHAKAFYDIADLILFDAKPPKGETIRGGHGISFDWSLIRAANMPEKFALAGGLNPDNIKAAARETRAPIFDVSSRVESVPGAKDHHKIQAFMRNLGK